VCGNHLFRSSSKFASTCGWPSFFQSEKDAVKYKKDSTHGMERIEVVCGRCDSHLGHVFNDGPEPTGVRYCMNSVSLDFVPDSESQR
jgi:peptide-methionine (R)-S-oxide reductase